MQLKPQDLLVALKLWASQATPAASLGGRARPWTFPELANALHMPMSVVHAAVKRAHAAGLIEEARAGSAVVTPALREFLVHGAKYAFPAERGAAARGIPTAHGAAPLANAFPPSEDAVPVWPHPQGTVFGQAFLPIHPAAPEAAQTDPLLYEVLALLDALRGGRARDRKLAGELLEQRVR